MYKKLALYFQIQTIIVTVDCDNYANGSWKVQILREYTKFVSFYIIKIERGLKEMKQKIEEYLIEEINYILRRNCDVIFLQSVLSRILILEQVKK